MKCAQTWVTFSDGATSSNHFILGPNFWKWKRWMRPIQHPTNNLQLSMNIPHQIFSPPEMSVQWSPKFSDPKSINFMLASTNPNIWTWQILHCTIVLDPNKFTKTQNISMWNSSLPKIKCCPHVYHPWSLQVDLICSSWSSNNWPTSSNCSDITNTLVGILGETGSVAPPDKQWFYFHSWCVTPHSSPTRGCWPQPIFYILNIFIFNYYIH